MTAKRDRKGKPKKERPKIKKETLKDLEAKGGENVKAGEVYVTALSDCRCSL